jgi:hypothetical protein
MPEKWFSLVFGFCWLIVRLQLHRKRVVTLLTPVLKDDTERNVSSGLGDKSGRITKIDHGLSDQSLEVKRLSNGD